MVQFSISTVNHFCSRVGSQDGGKSSDSNSTVTSPEKLAMISNNQKR